MIPIPPALISFLTRWAVVLGVALACMGFGAFKMHEHDQVAYDKLSAQYHDLDSRVKQAGIDYKAKVAEKEAKDKLDKEKADAKHTTDLAAARDDAARLRVERDDERGKRFLAQGPAGSKCPEGQVCFDRGLYRAAYGRLLQCVRSGADRCTAVEQALKNAMDWADGNP